MYHSVSSSSADSHLICTSPELFDSQMRAIARLGLQGVSVREFLERRKERKRLVAITFDDGYTDFLDNAVPILERLGFTATVFALSGNVTENVWDHDTSTLRLRLMSEEQLLECRLRGMEVGSHGASHSRFSTLDEATLRSEVFESRNRIEDIIGERVCGFCYPYGDYTTTVAYLVREAGYSYGCSVNPAPGDTLYSIPRIPVNNLDHLPRFLGKLCIYWRYRHFKERYGTLLRRS